MKCPACKSEWNIGASKSMQNITECPFCHAPLDNAQETSPDESTAAEQLRRFVSNMLRDFPNEEGSAIYKSYRFSALLTDLLVRFPKELRRCRIACEAKIPERLYSADKKTSDEQMNCIMECIYVLKDGWDMEENAAKETVALLAEGLGWKINNETTSRQDEKNDSDLGPTSGRPDMTIRFRNGRIALSSEEFYEALDSLFRNKKN